MDHINDVIKFRHTLHAKAELSGHEQCTAGLVKKFLLEYHPSEFLENLGGHGVAAFYHFGTQGPTLLFRCELDALPIDESSSPLPYKSENVDFSHKCGHDGHMAIVAGLAPILKNARYTKGKVILLFQPAEETGEGAKSVLDDPEFESIQSDYVFALHNLPGFLKHTVLIRSGTFTAAVCSMIVRFTGIPSHASEPEKGNNPSVPMARIALKANELTINLPDEENFRLITPVYTHMGQTAYGMSAGEGEMHFTLRAWTSENLNRLIQEFKEQIDEISFSHSLEVSYEFLECFASTQNDLAAVNIIADAAGRNKLVSENLKSPFKFGEDFGSFTQRYPGAMFGLGAGMLHPPLHHKDYDFPDDIIETGIKMFATICDLILSK